MTVFLIVLLLIGLVAGIGFLRHHRAHRPAPAPARANTPYAVHTQVRGVELQTQLTGAAFGLLLKAAHGNRQLVEQWILTEQHHNPTLRRDDVIEQLARRIELAASREPA